MTGNWDQTTAQKAVATVLPSLPEIVGVVTRAATAMAPRRPSPPPASRARPSSWATAQDELQWWKEQKDADGYETRSASIAPGVSTLAFWVAQQVLDGRTEMPQDLLVPYLAFTQDDFESHLPNIPVGGVASIEYTQDDAIAAICSEHEVMRIWGAPAVDLSERWPA